MPINLFDGLNYLPVAAFDVKAANTIDHMKAVIRLQISIDFPNMPWRFPLVLEPTDTVGSVRKGIIHNGTIYSELIGQTYIQKGKFVLFFGGNQLKDESSTIDECGIKHMGSIQVLESTEFSISIFSEHFPLGFSDRHPDEDLRNDSSKIVMMRCFETVGMLREKIHKKYGIPTVYQILVYNGYPLRDYDKLMVDYGIARAVKYDKPYTIRLMRKSPFWGRPKKKFVIDLLNLGQLSKPWQEDSFLLIAVEIPKMLRLLLKMKPTDTIGELRKQIMTVCGDPFDHPYIGKGMFVLFFGTRQLEEGNNTLLEYGIMGYMNSIRLFEEASFVIRILTFPKLLTSPEVYPRLTLVEVTCFETVGMLKEKLQDKVRVPKEEQKLRTEDDGWFLDDDEGRLIDYGFAKPVNYDLSRLPARNHQYFSNPFMSNNPPGIFLAPSKGQLDAVWKRVHYYFST